MILPVLIVPVLIVHVLIVHMQIVHVLIVHVLIVHVLIVHVLIVYVLIVPALIICNSSDRLFLYFASGSRASIFVRKTLRVRPRDQKALAFLARREGPAFFDEDDACAGFRISVTARLNYYMASLSLFKRLNNL